MIAYCKVFTCLLLLSASSCVPIPSKVSSGQNYSKETLAFLDSPNTTREDVIESLGPPYLEVQDSKVLLYVWETTSRSLLLYPDKIHEGELVVDAKKVDGNSQTWGLLIAYDSRKVVSVHEVRKIGSEGLEALCVEWGRKVNTR